MRADPIVSFRYVIALTSRLSAMLSGFPQGFTDHPQSGVLLTVDCLSVCLSVCLSGDNYRSSYLHIRYISREYGGSSSWHWVKVKVKVTGAKKVDNHLVFQHKSASPQ